MNEIWIIFTTEIKHPNPTKLFNPSPRFKKKKKQNEKLYKLRCNHVGIQKVSFSRDVKISQKKKESTKKIQLSIKCLSRYRERWGRIKYYFGVILDFPSKSNRITFKKKHNNNNKVCIYMFFLKIENHLLNKV